MSFQKEHTRKDSLSSIRNVLYTGTDTHACIFYTVITYAYVNMRKNQKLYYCVHSYIY